MIRTQMYIPANQHRALRSEAKREGVSMTELVRRILAAHFSGRRGIASFPKEAVLSFVALGRSGRPDVSERHDEALDDAFGGRAVR